MSYWTALVIMYEPFDVVEAAMQDIPRIEPMHIPQTHALRQIAVVRDVAERMAVDNLCRGITAAATTRSAIMKGKKKPPMKGGSKKGEKC